jgi:hypothetical protein
MEPEFSLHPDLQDASLEKACDLANWLANEYSTSDLMKDLHYMLEYLRLNFDLVEKK